VSESEFLYLTTTGRLSGQPRQIEIWFTERDGHYYLVAEHGERAGWVQNLRTDPRVTVRVGERVFPARARVVDAATDTVLRDDVRVHSERKYGGGDGLVIELSPGGESR
jgi:deazaflavin-dependent oxidoreductase (nitroreductase family)